MAVSCLRRKYETKCNKPVQLFLSSGFGAGLCRLSVTLVPSHGDTGTPTFAQVTSWQIESARVAQAGPLLPAIFDDDPIYDIEAQLRVTFEDGEVALLMWDSWSYGNVVGPLSIDRGSGPPGQIRPAMDDNR